MAGWEKRIFDCNGNGEIYADISVRIAASGKDFQSFNVYFSVIIPILNGEPHLAAFLSALERQKIENAEFILVDNGSTDNSFQLLQNFANLQNKDFNIKILRENKPGASAARNTGASNAAGQWLIFTDVDCIPEASWLSDYFTLSHAPGEIGAIAGCVKAFDAQNVVAKFLGLYTLPANTSTRTFDRFTLVQGGFPTANLAVRREIFEKIGGFDESIRIYGEDHDLCARIYRAGYKIKAVESAVVYHKHRTDIKGLLKQSFGFALSHALNLRRNVPGAFIFESPFFNTEKLDAGRRIWIDLNPFDKKIFAIIFLGLIWMPFLVLAPLYLIYMTHAIKQRAKKKGRSATIGEAAEMMVLLFLKSLAMTLGRIAGSLRYRVVCL